MKKLLILFSLTTSQLFAASVGYWQVPLNLNASQLTSGTVPTNVLPGALPTLSTWNGEGLYTEGTITNGTQLIPAAYLYDALEALGLYSVPTLTTVATDTGDTPSTTALTLGSSDGGVRVWTGETPIEEPFFHLYFQSGSGDVQDILMTRWESRIISAAAGEAAKFATSDGRVIYATPVNSTVTTLTAPSWITGTANCDKAGPPYWSPSAEHIKLPSLNSQFKIAATTDETIVFVSEYSPQGWTQPRWLRTETARDITVRATYRRIALANFDGTALSVSAPYGSTIGGASYWQRLTSPPVLRTVAVTDTAGLTAALLASQYGDKISLAAGTYELNAITNNLFSSVAGTMNGVSVVGATGNRDDVVLVLTNGWNTLGMSETNSAAMIKDLTMRHADVTNAFCRFKWQYSPLLVDNVLFDWNLHNTQAGVEITGKSVTTTNAAILAWCRVTDSGEDGYDGNAHTNIVLYGCSATNAVGASSQLVTMHSGGICRVYGGDYDTAQADLVSGDDNATRHGLFFGRYNKSTTSGSIHYGCMAFGCNFPTITDTAQPWTNGYIVASSFGKWNNSANVGGWQTISANKINSTTLPIDSRTGSLTFFGNMLMSGSTAGFRSSSHNDTAQTNNIWYNYVTGSANGFEFDASSPVTTFQNNSAADNTRSVWVSGGFTFALASNNTLDPTTTGYAAGTGDTTNVNAALDASFFPTASGNSDGNGATNAVTWVGGTDYWGLPLKYSHATTSRGPRERPILHTSAILIPDAW